MKVNGAFIVLTVFLFAPFYPNSPPGPPPPPCVCEHIATLQAELKNAKTLRDNFAKKIPDLQKFDDVLESKGALKQFLDGPVRKGVVDVPGYNGPRQVDYVPYGDGIDPSHLDKHSKEELCAMRNSAVIELEAAMNASACAGIGNALRAHENVHKQLCLATGYSSYIKMHGADRAREEAEAYDAQIKLLEQELANVVYNCKFNIKFDSQIERTQGSARELGRVRASLNVNASSLKDSVLELGPADTALEYLEYSWTDKGDCANSGTGSGGRFRMTSGRITLKPAEAPPRLGIASLDLSLDPGQTSEVHTVKCRGMTMSFPGSYWSAAFSSLHGGTTALTISDWLIDAGQDAQARKTFETTRECNKATCKEQTTIVLQQQRAAPVVAVSR